MALVLVELNEINFAVVEKYINHGEELPGFQSLIDGGIIETSAEGSYELLEPWIQWPSVHTGKTYDEHKIFRLGDVVASSDEQIFEVVESMGYRVGALSPMNAVNRLLAPAYFIPDPWTDTKNDGALVSRFLHKALVQAVNDNSKERITLGTLLRLAFVFFATVPLRKSFYFLRYTVGALGRPWRKALLLDKLIYEVHVALMARTNPDFSTIFLNAGAHIQHHYFLNAAHIGAELNKNPEWYISKTEDPLCEMLHVYDSIIADVVRRGDDVIVATGLSQKPYEEATFYYRLRNHEDFLRQEGIEFLKVEPRMTRDFLITFQSEESALEAKKTLSKMLVGGVEPLFGEIDVRGAEIFATLTYPREILPETTFTGQSGVKRLLKSVVFVAVKNGEHRSTGYCYLSSGICKSSISHKDHVSALFFVIQDYFRSKKARLTS